MKFDLKRRHLLKGGMSALTLGPFGFAYAQSSVLTRDAYVPRVRHALLIGNGDYPGRKDIPPARKNVLDMQEALEYLEFNVTARVDLGEDAMREALLNFRTVMKDLEDRTPPGALAVVFYFCGHGFQTDGQNFIVPAGVDPSGERAAKQSIKLQDEVLSVMPRRYPGISIALVDACRTDPTFKRGVDDFNQIQPPEGTVVFFGTRAGRPALSPIDPNKNTFFTASVLKAIRSMNAVMPVTELFRSISEECQDTVRRVLESANLKFAPQYPEVSNNLRGTFILRTASMPRPRPTQIPPQAPGTSVPSLTAEQLEKKIESMLRIIRETLQPRRLIRLTEEFLKQFPNDANAETLRIGLAGAQEALKAQRAASLSSDALEDAAGDADYRDDLGKALRGDKDSAHRIANLYRTGGSGLKRDIRRTEQWLRFASELGNGIASWKLAELYIASGQQADAARYEARAIELGYRPPPRLSNKGY